MRTCAPPHFDFRDRAAFLAAFEIWMRRLQERGETETSICSAVARTTLARAANGTVAEAAYSISLNLRRHAGDLGARLAGILDAEICRAWGYPV